MSAWESRLVLVGACEVKTLGYKSILGSCNLDQRMWRYAHFKTEYHWNGFAAFDNDTHDIRISFHFSLYLKICNLWYIMWSMMKVQMLQASQGKPAPLVHHHCEASSPTLCNHNLYLFHAGQLAYQISSKSCVCNSTISISHSKYFPHPYKPSGGHLSKLSATDTHYVKQLISSWKAVSGAKIAKTLVDIEK